MDLVYVLGELMPWLKFYGAVILLACGLMGLYWLGVAILAGRR